MYSKYFFRHKTPSKKHPFKLPSKFTPPLPDNDNLIEYISLIYNDLKNKPDFNRTHKRNITNDELKSLNDLKNNKDIVIKPADKGGSIVLWPRREYLTEA